MGIERTFQRLPVLLAGRLVGLAVLLHKAAGPIGGLGDGHRVQGVEPVVHLHRLEDHVVADVPDRRRPAVPVERGVPRASVYRVHMVDRVDPERGVPAPLERDTRNHDAPQQSSRRPVGAYPRKRPMRAVDGGVFAT